MDPLIKLDKVSVVYNQGEIDKEIVALQDISLEIYPREYVIFFGPSGCGKSTLMNVIAGLEEITSGQVEVASRDLKKLTDEELSTYHRHQLGFIFQAYNLIPTLSVLENIALPQLFDGLSKTQWAKNAVSLAGRFGIKEQVKKLPQELSGGQQQRVGVARALINNPSILLADEPAGNLDSKNARHILDIFQELNLNEKKTILMVTHSPDNLGEADRIFYLKDGKIIDEVRNKSRKIQTFKMKTEGEQKEKDLGIIGRTYPWKRLLKDTYVLPSLKAEKLIRFILNIPGEQKIFRLNQLIEKHLQGILNPLELETNLDKPYFKGGAGLNSRSARKVRKMTEHLILNARAINKLSEFSEDKSSQIISLLAYSLMAFFHLKLNELQNKRLFGILKDRLSNKIDPQQVKKLLDIPTEQGGVGLRHETAVKVMHYLELLILIANQKTKENV